MAWTEESRDKAAVTRQQNKEARAVEKIAEAGGVGESRVFRNPDALDPYERLRQCHMGGKLISEHFTDDQIALFSYHITDEGIAERNAGKSDLRASVTKDPLAKAMEQRTDDVKVRGMETWEAKDPMKELVDQHIQPGMKARFLSDSVVSKKGMRGFEPVRDEEGKLVKLGGMTLAQMPIEKAAARNRHFQELGNQRLAQVQQEYVKSGGQTAVSDQ